MKKELFVTLRRNTTLSAIMFCAAASAAVSPEEAAQLGQTLTPMGAERAGNAQGTIAPWNPQFKFPEHPNNTDAVPDPFAQEKPLLTITGLNMDKYAQKLSDGSKMLLKKFPTYALRIYPSHRHLDMPSWVKENVLRNAVHAKTVADGLGVEGARGGIPFPIPKNGIEVMWNQTLRYAGPPQLSYFASYLVDANGNRQMVNDVITYIDSPYYARTDPPSSTYARILSGVVGPARIAGSIVLEKKSLRPDQDTTPMYVFDSATKRTRSVSDFAYDTPVMTYGGAIFFDELGMFNGRMDKFDFKLLGKREMFIPYNNFAAVMAPVDQYVGKQHTNAAFERWELHRVWVVEATLKKGERHAQSRKVFYIDEDTWAPHLYEAYDSSNTMTRIGLCFVTPDYAHQSLNYAPLHVFYDLLKGQLALLVQGSGRKGFTRVEQWPDGRLTPSGMAGSGIL